MPQSPLPEKPKKPEEPEGASAAREIQMRWLKRSEDDDQPVLLEVSVGASWASTDLGRHLVDGIIDVELKAPDDIYENLTPEPPGSPIPLGAGQQVLITCELWGALFDA